MAEEKKKSIIIQLKTYIYLLNMKQYFSLWNTVAWLLPTMGSFNAYRRVATEVLSTDNSGKVQF